MVPKTSHAIRITGNTVIDAPLHVANKAAHNVPTLQKLEPVFGLPATRGRVPARCAGGLEEINFSLGAGF